MKKEMTKNFENSKKSLREIISDLFFSFSENEKYYSDLGNIVSVNLTDATAEVKLIDGAIIPDVRLQQVKTASGIIIEPTVESLVIISYNDNTTAYISMHSEIENIVFQDGLNGGLIKITDLTTKLNNLNTEIAAELVKIATGITGAGGAYTPGTLTTFDKDDFENEKFSH